MKRNTKYRRKDKIKEKEEKTERRKGKIKGETITKKTKAKEEKA